MEKRPPSAVRRDLVNSTRDGAGWSVMVGLGELAIPAFSLAAGHGPVKAGLVATVPFLAGALLQLGGPAAVARLRSLRTWVVLCSGLQAAAFLPMAAGGLLGGIPFWGLFAAASIYWGAGLATGPAWATWIETLVPRRIRGRYFGRRGLATNAVLLLAVVAGGEALHAGGRGAASLPVFGAVFLAAAAGRAASAWFLSRHREVWTPACRSFGPREWFARMRGTPAGRVLAYLLAVQAALNVAVPFLTPWILEGLGYGYREWMLLTAAPFLARAVATPWLGRLADRAGPRTVLLLAGLGFVPVHALWMLGGGLPWLLALQLLWGVLSAAFELAALILYFETIPREDRLGLLTGYFLGTAAAVAGGSLAGGWILDAMGQGAPAYHAIFAVSSVLRLLCLPLLLRVPGGAGKGLPGPLRWLSRGGTEAKGAAEA